MYRRYFLLLFSLLCLYAYSHGQVTIMEQDFESGTSGYVPQRKKDFATLWNGKLYCNTREYMTHINDMYYGNIWVIDTSSTYGIAGKGLGIRAVREDTDTKYPTRKILPNFTYNGIIHVKSAFHRRVIMPVNTQGFRDVTLSFDYKAGGNANTYFTVIYRLFDDTTAVAGAQDMLVTSNFRAINGIGMYGTEKFYRTGATTHTRKYSPVVVLPDSCCDNPNLQIGFDFVYNNQDETIDYPNLCIDNIKITGCPVAGKIVADQTDDGYEYQWTKPRNSVACLRVRGFPTSFSYHMKFQWQQSTNQETWEDINLATDSIYYTGTIIPDTTYYRCKVWCLECDTVTQQHPFCIIPAPMVCKLPRLYFRQTSTINDCDSIHLDPVQYESCDYETEFRWAFNGEFLPNSEWDMYGLQPLDVVPPVSGTYSMHIRYKDDHDCTASLDTILSARFASPLTEVNIEECNQWYWQAADTTYTQSGVYTRHFLNQYDCDSTVTVTLTINESPVRYIDTTMEHGSVFTYRDSSMTVLFEDNRDWYFSNAEGCDSLIKLHVKLVYKLPKLTFSPKLASECGVITLAAQQSGITTCTPEYMWKSGNTNLLNNWVTLFPNEFSVTSFEGKQDGKSYKYKLVARCKEQHSTQNSIDTSLVLRLPSIHVDTVKQSCGPYIWDKNSKTYDKTGVYKDTLTILTPTGCYIINTLIINVFPERKKTIDTTLCVGNTFAYKDSSITITPDLPEVLVWSFANPNGCDSVITIQLHIINPNVHITANPTDVCEENQPVTLTAVASDVEDFLWNNGETSATTTVMGAGTYTLKGSKKGCVAHDTITINFQPHFATIVTESEVCQGGTAHLSTPDEAIATYTWTDLYDNVLSEEATLDIIMQQDTTIRLIAINTAGCRDTTSASIAMIPMKAIEIEQNPANFCEYHTATLVVQSPRNAEYYQWNTGQNTQRLTVSEAGTYTVTVSKDGCITSKSISIQECDCEVFIPTGFSPNNDHLNDSLAIVFASESSDKVTDIDVSIYNLNGKLVFNASAPDTHNLSPLWWSGKNNDGGTSLPGYYYIWVEFKCFGNRKSVQKSITLVK